MSILPATNIINVTIEGTPSGLTEKNVNSLAIYTNEVPINPDVSLAGYGIYISPQQVVDDWGTDSDAAAMANAVFAQVPNILSGEGRLVLVPMLAAISATIGNFATPDISANLATLQAVNNGDLRVTVNGTAHNLANLDFTPAQSLADIATILQKALPAGITVTATGVQIFFNSDKVGAASTVALAVNAAGGTDLTGATMLHSAAGVATGGANSSGETILQCLARTGGLVGYVPIMTNIYLEDTAIVAAAAGIQAVDNMFLHHCSSIADIAGIATTISQATETKTRLLLYTVGQAAANIMKAAYAGRAFSTDFTGSNTSSTMNLKSLATITPDLGISETNYVNANIAGIDIYVSYDGVPAVYSTEGNDFFDNPYSDLALKFALVVAGFDYLRQTNTKIPQTEPGMNGLKSAYAQVMEQFVNNGELAPGQWNSGETFGPNPQIFNQNITAKGYYIYSLPVAQQSAVDRDARKAPLVQIAAKRAGAIQTSNVLVLVNN